MDTCQDAPSSAEPEGCLDDVVAYSHIASVTSASESKAASMKWWQAASTLSRKLKFIREIAIDPSEHEPSCLRQAGYSQRSMSGRNDMWMGFEDHDY